MKSAIYFAHELASLYKIEKYNLDPFGMATVIVDTPKIASLIEERDANLRAEIAELKARVTEADNQIRSIVTTRNELIEAATAKLQAECAARLVKAVALIQAQFNACGMDDGRIPLAHVRKQVLALIPADYAAALADEKRKARLEEHEKLCTSCQCCISCKNECLRGSQLRAAAQPESEKP